MEKFTESEVPCSNCGGQCVEFSIDSRVWNQIVRGGGPEHGNEYLCAWCFIQKVEDWCLNRIEEDAAGKDRR